MTRRADPGPSAGAPSALPPYVLPGSRRDLLRQRAEGLAALVTTAPEPGAVASLFADDVLAGLPATGLAQTLNDLHGRIGHCLRVDVVGMDGAHSGLVQLLSGKGFRVEARLVLQPHPPGLIRSFRLEPPHRLPRDWAELAARVERLPGRAALLVAELGAEAPRPVVSVDAADAMAVGCVVKLWILAALVRAVAAGERSWSDVVTLDAALRSRPSGQLQDWPADAPVTLHTLATLMVAASDNTAADHLLAHLGRDRVLDAMAGAGHSSVARNTPLPSTMDMARLKGDLTGDLRRRYAAADAFQRRRILDEDLPRLPAGDLSVPELPADIETVEWFASAWDACRCLDWLRRATDRPGPAAAARDVLAVNGGLGLPPQQWSYVGFKGGAEAGVASIAALLERRADGAWFALSATWNDAREPVDTRTLLELVRDAAHLAEDAGPAWPRAGPAGPTSP